MITIVDITLIAEANEGDEWIIKSL
jgi:hypothetical protein